METDVWDFHLLQQSYPLNITREREIEREKVECIKATICWEVNHLPMLPNVVLCLEFHISDILCNRTDSVSLVNVRDSRNYMSVL